MYLILDFLESFFFQRKINYNIFHLFWKSVTKGRYNTLFSIVNVAILWAQWAQEQQISSQIKYENGQWHGPPY